MEEIRVGHHNPKSLSQMNSNMELFSNMASSLEGFNTTVHGIMPVSNEGFSDHQQTQLPMAFNHIQRSIGPNVPMFDPMAHFFPSGHGCYNMNMMPEPEIMVNSSPSVSGTGFLGHSKVNKKHEVQVFLVQ